MTNILVILREFATPSPNGEKYLIEQNGLTVGPFGKPQGDKDGKPRSPRLKVTG